MHELKSIEPGLYPNMSREAYERVPAINFSSLKHFRRTPAHFREEMIHPSDPTKAREFGHAYHLAMFEPDRFRAEVVRGLQGVDKRTKAGKSQWAKFEAEHGSHEILMPDEFDAVASMQAAMMLNDTARELLTCEGGNELAVVWIDEETGELCKGRI